MKDKVNYKMVTLARESRAMTQKELATKIPNLVQGNLSRMEKGILTIPDETLNNIAKCLNYPLNFFYKEEIKTPISNFYYRKRISFPKKDLSFIEAQMDIIRLTIDEFLHSIELPEYKLPSIDISVYVTPDDAARYMRDFFKLPKGPIDNLVNVLEKHGILIYFINSISDKFDGITMFTDKGQPIMFVNKNKPNDRKRFTICHELAHLVLHIPFSLEDDKDVEHEANRFAGEFLMPYLDCRNDLNNLKYNDLTVLKGYWKLSKAAIIYRSKEMKAITDEKFKYLMIELTRRGERKNELGNVYLDEPTLLKRIIKAHLDDLGYSIDEILSMIGLTLNDFNHYFNGQDDRKLRIVA